jgi:CubicO group peptidase (beta-lactamase class C family)
MKQSIVIMVTLAFLVACEPVREETSLEAEIARIESQLTTAVIQSGQNPKYYSIADRMDHHKVPGVSIAVVKDGKLRWAKGYGIANTVNNTMVDTNTIFQAGSISKPVAALAALRLWQEGKIDLDTDVNEYLVNWKIPENDFDSEEKVTIRRLLTHTAGTTVHGFPGYKPSEDFPTITEVLNGQGNTDSIKVDTTPGTNWRYSGGGYTIMEKVVEDVSGMPLEQYMRTLLDQIGMINSTYSQPLDSSWHNRASAAYDSKGALIEGDWHNYPEQAAAGLWTTPSDLALYCMEIQQIVNGKSNGVLSQTTVGEMLTKHDNDWGLGPALAWEGDSLRFQHGGKNAGFTNQMIAFANYGEAVIIMTNADNGGKLMNEILRSISNYYGWNIRNPKEVVITSVTERQKVSVPGKYVLNQEVPGIGQYIVELEFRENELMVFDPNNDETDILSPTSDSTFIDMEDGDRVSFAFNNDSISFEWNGYYQFYKLTE